ncbi:hypothetical protein BBK36DRAFT_1170745 [Trichoderma citrinoviride]|uniref:Uncharacterized protein n=1 Tax=Trichoderma citrinoviride TaxID=58853 RepID=A0A2T4B4N6_9HYPO|nr:hypothetical protein BBK36DRAFT_1170745 [Trichoderma citrinoviride]PTB64171.1 hypothetical protein BBK36DRAFT_1170745 [Trichoderma citrinoviride]
MFCSSLRQRKDWAAVVLLLSSEEAKAATAKARIERLSMLDGGNNVAVILLMEKSGCVDSLVDLQMSIMAHGMSSMPIVPISSASELASRLDTLRRQFANAANNLSRTSSNNINRADGAACAEEEEEELRDLASHCVHGQAAPLPPEHIDVVTDLAAGLGSLAQLVLCADGQRRIRDLLGEAQGGRVIAFFTHGHQHRTVAGWASGVERRRSATNAAQAQAVGRGSMLR